MILILAMSIAKMFIEIARPSATGALLYAAFSIMWGVGLWATWDIDKEQA